jgi:hypothetical protein
MRSEHVVRRGPSTQLGPLIVGEGLEGVSDGEAERAHGHRRGLVTGLEPPQ